MLAEELDRYLKGEPILARPASPVRKVVSWGRRHPGILAALAALALVALAFGAYYLYEENTYLRFQQANPHVVRVDPGSVRPGDVLEPGKIYDSNRPRAESLNEWQTINGMAMLPGFIFLFYLYTRASGGLPKNWRERMEIAVASQEVLANLPSTDRKQATFAFDNLLQRPAQPLGERTRAIALGVGLLMIFFSGMVLVKTIQANVWEGVSIWGSILPIYVTTYLGLLILKEVVRDYHLTYYGPPSSTEKAESRALTTEQAASIRTLVETGEWKAARALYRQTLPEAPTGEEYVYVLRLVESLRKENPSKYAWPPLEVGNMNFRGMLTCALVEAVVLGAKWLLWPPAYPVAAILLFAYSFLFGVGLTALRRTQGWWKRLLWLVPALVVMVISEAVLHTMAGSWRTSALYVAGFFCGVILMGCGLAGEAGRALQKKLGAAPSNA
jgi:hypothetical protein